MRFNRSKVICAVAVLCIGIAASAFWEAEDPEYKSRNLSKWFEDLSEADSREAETAIAHFGQSSVPFLLTRLEPPRPPVSVSLKDWFETRVLRRPKFVGCGLAQASEFWTEQQRISKAFAALGTNALVALPDLEKLLRRNEAVDTALIALVSIGKPALPILTKAFNSSDSELRPKVVNHLGQMRSGQSESAELLFKALTDSDPLIRHYAAYAIGELGSEPDRSVQLLTTALEDSDSRVRYISVYALKRFGNAAQPAISALNKLLADNEENVRKGAEEVIAELSK